MQGNTQGCRCAREGAVRWRARSPRSGTPTRGPAADIPMFPMFRSRGQPAGISEYRRHGPSAGAPSGPPAWIRAHTGRSGKIIRQRSEHRPQNALSMALRGHPRRGRARLRNNVVPALPTHRGETMFASAARRQCAASETPKRNIDARRARGHRLRKSPGSGRHAPPESWRAYTRRLVRLGSDASSRATPPRNRNSGTRTTNVPTYRRDQGPQVGTHDTNESPLNTTRQRPWANLTIHVQQRSKSESSSGDVRI